MWHSRDIAFALKCQIYPPPLCPNVSGVCCTRSPFCPSVSCGLSCFAYFSAFPAERMQEDAMGWSGRAAGVGSSLLACARPCAAAGLGARGRGSACAAESLVQQQNPSCLQGFLEKPSADIPLGWEQSLLHVLAGSFCLSMGTGHPQRLHHKDPRLITASGCDQRFVFSFLPYPGGLYLNLAETCGKTCWLLHELKLWLASPSAICLWHSAGAFLGYSSQDKTKSVGEEGEKNPRNIFLHLSFP